MLTAIVHPGVVVVDDTVRVVTFGVDAVCCYRSCVTCQRWVVGDARYPVSCRSLSRARSGDGGVCSGKGGAWRRQMDGCVCGSKWWSWG